MTWFSDCPRNTLTLKVREDLHIAEEVALSSTSNKLLAHEVFFSHKMSVAFVANIETLICHDVFLQLSPH